MKEPKKSAPTSRETPKRERGKAASRTGSGATNIQDGFKDHLPPIIFGDGSFTIQVAKRFVHEIDSGRHTYKIESRFRRLLIMDGHGTVRHSDDDVSRNQRVEIWLNDAEGPPHIVFRDMPGEGEDQVSFDTDVEFDGPIPNHTQSFRPHVYRHPLSDEVDLAIFRLRVMNEGHPDPVFEYEPEDSEHPDNLEIKIWTMLKSELNFHFKRR